MMRPLLSRQHIGERLQMLFPREAFDTVASSPQATAAVAAMLYVDAVVPDFGAVPDSARWARPVTVLWMSDAAYQRSDTASRTQWSAAERSGNRAVGEVLRGWGDPFVPWYADNSRETLRDETLPLWLGFGAVRVRPGVPTTSSAGRWAITTSFADLFAPALTGEALTEAIDVWRETHMKPGDRLRIQTAQAREQRSHSVAVRMPDGTERHLEPGDASHILKGVVETWATRRLIDPIVLTISEPGQKILVADNAVLTGLGVSIDAATLLPDALIADIGAEPDVTFWIIEAVASDGPIDEDRKAAIIEWADAQRIPVASCRFLSAFLSRNDGAARRRLKDLAAGTFAWYADEPTLELAWYDLNDL